ncbi:MAG: hypothetical protein GWP10_03085 [Nitrospiraceae bacterium]|nr:hypothetical protein [Nitrospiraceae bacterium]
MTRAKEQAGEFVKLLESRGAYSIECPTIEFHWPEDLNPLDRAINTLPTFDWVVFSSTNAVHFFFERLFRLGFDLRALGNIHIAAVGPGSAKAISALHLNTDLIPKNFQAEGLIEAFSQIGISGKHILIPRAEVAREILPKSLSELGAEVVLAPAYRTLAPELRPECLETLGKGPLDLLTFTSPSTVKNFFHLFPDNLRETVLEQAKVACIGPITARTAEGLGLNVTIEPDKSTIPALVSAIEACYS